MVMFDSLNRRFLPPYGADWIHAPNFERLAARSVTFDNCYAGSMPCMPARRELHTGRYNFLHRSWGPLEPFDDSVPEILRHAGVYTHLVTDHQHYWEDGGATYHNRYNTYEFFRGQEGDAWKGHVADPDIPKDAVRVVPTPTWRQDWVNRTYLADEADHPQTLVFDAGLHFIETNRFQDAWFLQIETFDPHEPFFSYAHHKQHYYSRYKGPHFDWPEYKRVDEAADLVLHARHEYAALVTMCDASLGRVLDAMDAFELWDDTLLIVCTDHGFLLGEHGWWGKTVQPWFDETIHTPLFIWDPRTRVAGERRDALVQTIDLGPTLLDYFSVAMTDRMQGRPLASVVADNESLRVAGMFGSFGGHVSVTDGRYVYMRASADATNRPLDEYTLMPMHMRSRYEPAELAQAALVPPLAFTREAPVLRVPSGPTGNPWPFGTLLFDLMEDPNQQHPLIDDELELHMIELLLALMRANHAPSSQYARLGLPEHANADRSHLQARLQFDQVIASQEPVPSAHEYRPEYPSVNSPIGRLYNDPHTRRAMEHTLGPAAREFAAAFATNSMVEIAAFDPTISRHVLKTLEDALSVITPGSSE
jgi:arylsulfatase A-like enzyme